MLEIACMVFKFQINNTFDWTRGLLIKPIDFRSSKLNTSVDPRKTVKSICKYKYDAENVFKIYEALFIHTCTFLV